ncbi:sterol O-acyltransferase [Malassezia psittaci]|uniref:Sterol O-acyltransferase n=1 Tax=Malassezia psittaci TaxID=1821823 RepID=A0AAF0JEZ9_9BASI|nr:sterol O-acyltransferase [Malassezia psittaci]
MARGDSKEQSMGDAMHAENPLGTLVARDRSLSLDTGGKQVPVVFEKRQGNQIFRTVTYVPRASLLDRDNLSSAKDPFRGFYTLFWISMVLLVMNLFITSMHSTGELLSMTFASLMSRDAIMLALSDAVIVGATFFCVLMVKVMYKYKLRYAKRVVFLLYLYHALMLTSVISWSQYRYMTVNGTMSDTHQILIDTESKLAKQLAEHYCTDVDHAWEKGINDLHLGSKSLSAVPKQDESHDSLYARWASRPVQSGTSSERAQKLYAALCTDLPKARSPVPEQHRLIHALQSNRLPNHPRKDQVDVEHEEARDPHPFFWHTDPKIKDLACRIVELRDNLYEARDESRSVGPMWPDNVSVSNFWDFQLIPCLVYKLRYPRTQSVRKLYVLERILALFGTFFVLYVTTVNLIMPVSMDPTVPLFEAFIRLAPPMMLCYLLLFYLMFECVCNAFAELTRFADREFYKDWWNSASMDEFSRKWNGFNIQLGSFSQARKLAHVPRIFHPTRSGDDHRQRENERLSIPRTNVSVPFDAHGPHPPLQTALGFG